MSKKEKVLILGRTAIHTLVNGKTICVMVRAHIFGRIKTSIQVSTKMMHVMAKAK